MRSPVITSIESLRGIFMGDKKPYWRLYSGKSVNGRATKKVGDNTEVDDLEEAFELLEDRLESYGNGTFSVVLVKDTSHNNNQGTVHNIQLSNQSAGLGASAGMAPFQQFLQFWQLMNQQTAVNDEATINGIQEEIETRLEIERLKRELAEANKRTQKDKILDAVVGQLPLLLPRLLGQPTAGIAGTLATDIQDKFDTEGEGKEELEGGFSIDQIVIQVNELQGILQMPAASILDKLIKFASSNPEQAQQLINSL